MSTTRKRIKPARPGLIIRDPHTKRALPDKGADVKLSSFWLRRLRDGDVVPAEGPKPAPKAPAKPKKADS
jgi:hypothetical protein